MNDERNKILQMVQDGTITAEEANDLLAALKPETPPAKPARLPDEVITSTPDPTQFRRPWEIPVTTGAVLVGAGRLLAARTRAKFLGRATMVVGGVTTLIGWQSRSSPWIHIRVKEKDGQRIAISLPLPLPLVQGGINLARHFADDDTADHLEIASSLLEMLQDMPPDQPLSVEVNDDDGDHVQVFIG